jgi:hypothetical protein
MDRVGTTVGTGLGQGEMADKMPICYPFPGANVENGYRIFPDYLENDEFVAFHGTAEANLSSIIGHGFTFAGSLRSLSFATSSSLALGYACRARTDTSLNGCVLTVRFGLFDRPGIVVETSVIHVHKLDEQPAVIGYCIVPADYEFV